MSQHENACHFSAHSHNLSFCEVLQLNTACSTQQAKQQPHLPLKYDSLLTSSKGSTSGWKYLWKTDLLVCTMITTQRFLRSIVFLAPCPRSRV